MGVMFSGYRSSFDLLVVHIILLFIHSNEFSYFDFMQDQMMGNMICFLADSIISYGVTYQVITNRLGCGQG